MFASRQASKVEKLTPRAGNAASAALLWRMVPNDPLGDRRSPTAAVAPAFLLPNNQGAIAACGVPEAPVLKVAPRRQTKRTTACSFRHPAA
jgi:hypothetical protein